MLERLNKVPKDISNVQTLLLSRELQDSDFEKLKKAYQRLGANDREYKDEYKLLFFQHFLNLTLKDADLRKEIQSYIPAGINCAFENDILKCTHDFVVTIIDKGLNNFKEEINKYFVGLSSSEHKNYEPVYNALFDSLKTRQNQFDFLNVIDSTKESRVAKVSFGQLLIKKYSEAQPSQTETLAMQNINELQSQIKKDEENAKKNAEEERLKQEEIKKQREEKGKQQNVKPKD